MRELFGANVSFNEFGKVEKVSFPSDFSLAYITGLPPGTTPEAVVGILQDLRFSVSVEGVRISLQPTSQGSHTTNATVKVEDPSFAKNLEARIVEAQLNITATQISTNRRRANCRKLHVSWHKATRNVWLNFGDGSIAERVAQKFNDGRYKCLNQAIKSSSPKWSSVRRGGIQSFHHPVAWSITLSGVPGDATEADMREGMDFSLEKPSHVEMGRLNYLASAKNVGKKVRSQLERHGRLTDFYLAPTSKGKRVKAVAWFDNEADARSASSLDNTRLDSLGSGKLTISMIQSVKFKVSTATYRILKSSIERERIRWAPHGLKLHVYGDEWKPFKTLKIDGDNATEVANARKTLEYLLREVILTSEGKDIWSPALARKGVASTKLQAIEKDLQIVIIRDKTKRQLRCQGSEAKFDEVVRRVLDILQSKESYETFKIELEADEFSWAMKGGFKSIQMILGEDIAIFNVVSKELIIMGTKEQYDIAMTIMKGKREVESGTLPEDLSNPDVDCPICFCPAENPIRTSCKHTYCLECFEECCRSAASTSKSEFHIKCHGNSGACPTKFTLAELKEHLSSSVFESVLKSCFEEYVQRHPESFHYCPTPDCGYIYRSTTNTLSGSKPAAYTCPNCLEPTCTSCHAMHGEYTCAEYKDIASGGYEALEKLKKELNIKDCPKCSTPMEKTDGCNHMTCGGCKAHICWVCLAVFEASGPCYSHLRSEHGGIGLEVNPGLMDDGW
jgi:hypothetical protein